MGQIIIPKTDSYGVMLRNLCRDICDHACCLKHSLAGYKVFWCHDWDHDMKCYSMIIMKMHIYFFCKYRKINTWDLSFILTFFSENKNTILFLLWNLYSSWFRVHIFIRFTTSKQNSRENTYHKCIEYFK